MKMIGKSVLVIFVFLCGLGVEAQFTHRQTVEEDGTFTEDHIFISPKCAAVIISGGALGGDGLAYAITPALCTARFCQAGVTPSSFASWWQSTMPLIKGGSLFATLQSIAMGGVGNNVDRADVGLFVDLVFYVSNDVFLQFIIHRI